MEETIQELESRIKQTRKDIYTNLNGWQRVQLSRHPERPYTLYYIEQMCRKFVELHGDRNFGDDKAIVGGIGNMDGQTVVILGHQKGVNTKMRQYRNFGMANPEGSSASSIPPGPTPASKRKNVARRKPSHATSSKWPSYGYRSSVPSSAKVPVEVPSASAWAIT